MRKLGVVAAAMLAMVVTGSARAAVIDLTFENIAPYPNGNDVYVQDYYNGGTSSIGTSGPNYGVSFSSNALVLCMNTPGVYCSNTSRGGQGDPNSQLAGLYFLSGSQTYMNVAAGFSNGFSLEYSAPYYSGTVNVYDGLNGTGNVLATLDLPTTSSACSGLGGYCPFYPVGVTFSGKAESVGFGGLADYIAYDDVTFGSATPGKPAPEPAALAVLGVGLVGLGLARRRR